MITTQPPQQAANWGEDPRSNWEIERDTRMLYREAYAGLLEAAQQYRQRHACIMHNIQTLELREARSRERFDWPQPDPPRPSPNSMPLAMRRPEYHLSAGIQASGNLGRMQHPLIVEAEERRRNTNG